MKRAWLPLTLALLAAACGSGRREDVPVDFVVHAPVVGLDGPLDDAPYVGADHLVTWLERRDGTKVAGSERSAPYPTHRLTLSELPFGSDLVLRVDVFGGSILLARGRSFPFDVARGGAGPAPDLFVGSPGRFGRRISESFTADVTAALPTADGALVAMADGRLATFRPLTQPAIVATGTMRATNAQWFAIGARFLGAFDPSTKVLSLFAPDGSLAATLTDPLLARHGAGSMWAADPAGTTLLAVGGLDASAGEVATAVTRIDLPDDVTAATVSPFVNELPSSRWAGSLVWVEGATSDATRAVVLGGQSHGNTTNAYLIDPRGGGAVATVDASAIPLAGATPIAMAAGQILLVGGASADDVRLLVVAATPTPSIAVASPRPPPLSVRRDAPRLARFADGLVLVVGGTSSGTLIRSAEIVDLRVFPGSTVQTGGLPTSVQQPLAIPLVDGSVWVLDRGGVFAYVPPRGP